jgi:serine O-acetyltransferase
MMVVYNAGFSAVFKMRLARELQERRWRRLAMLVRRLNTILNGVELRPEAEVEPGLFLPHPYGVGVGSGCRLGKDVTLYQGVSLGTKSIDGPGKTARSHYPRIEDGVVIYANALVYGDIEIGERAIILGNSVVSGNVPPGAMYGGMPAREIKRGNDEH